MDLILLQQSRHLFSAVTLYHCYIKQHSLFVSAVHLASYLTGLSSVMLLWAVGARCKWRAHLHNRRPLRPWASTLPPNYPATWHTPGDLFYAKRFRLPWSSSMSFGGYPTATNNVAGMNCKANRAHPVNSHNIWLTVSGYSHSTCYNTKPIMSCLKKIFLQAGAAF